MRQLVCNPAGGRIYFLCLHQSDLFSLRFLSDRFIIISRIETYCYHEMKDSLVLCLSYQTVIDASLEYSARSLWLHSNIQCLYLWGRLGHHEPQGVMRQGPSEELVEQNKPDITACHAWLCLYKSIGVVNSDQKSVRTIPGDVCINQ